MKWIDRLKRKIGSEYMVVQQVRVYYKDPDDLADTMYYKTTVVNRLTCKNKIIKTYTFMNEGLIIYLWW